MRATIMLIATAVAVETANQGAPYFALAIAIIAFLEWLGEPLSRSRRLRRQLRQLVERIAQGQTQESLNQMEPGLKRYFSRRWRYGFEKPENALIAETLHAVGLPVTEAEAVLLLAVLKGELSEQHRVESLEPYLRSLRR